jgi:hypothetical protein
MSNIASLKFRLFLAMCGMFCGCGVADAAEAKTYPPGIQALVLATRSIVDIASERADFGRSTQRLEAVRSVLYVQLRSPKPITISLAELQEVKLICDPREQHVVVPRDRDFLRAVAGKIEETATTSKIDNITSALRAMFASYSIDIADDVPTDKEIKQIRADIRTRCLSDLKRYDAKYYGVPPATTTALVPPPEVGVLSSLSALVKAFLDIITPAIVETAKLIDEKTRHDAIVEFLRDEDNRTAIRQASERLSTAIAAFLDDRRHQSMGKLIEKVAAVRLISVDLQKIDGCKAGLDKWKDVLESRPSGTPHDFFVQCYSAAWGAYSAAAGDMAKAADEYDKLADAGRGQEAKAYQEIAKRLDAVADRAYNNANLPALWEAALRLLAIAQKVEQAASKENKDKISKLIDDLVKRF